MKPTLPFVEVMATQACNLSCEGCTNYSDYNIRDNISWATVSQWVSAWLERVDIPDFGIIGGEPLLNKEISQWLVGSRNLMPNSQLRFTTNATLLSKKLSILDTVFDVGNCVFKISVHQPSEFYIQEALNSVFNYTDWQPVIEHGIHRWKANNGVRLQINFPKFFYKTFVGSFKSMMPHQSVPEDAFSICCQQTCPLLYNGNIYKCSSIALLDKTLTDWQQSQKEWLPFRNYKGISPNCSDIELKNFIDNFGKPEYICEMCPGTSDSQSRLDHSTHVITKTEWIKLHET